MNDLITYDNGVANIISELTFTVIPKLDKSSRKLIKKEQEVVFDLSKVGGCDNSGVALLVSLASYANSLGKKISFSKLPKQLLDLLEAGRVKELLPII